MDAKPSTIRLSPARRQAIDDVRHASISRQAWVDAAIDRALLIEVSAPVTPRSVPFASDAHGPPRTDASYQSVLAERQRRLEKERKR